MTKLAETYLHFDVDAPIDFQREAETFLFECGVIFTKELFGQKVNIEVVVDEGSLKCWLIIVGSLYAAVTSYGSFRTGIDYLIKDSRKLSNKVISTFVNESGIPESQIVRTEKRLGTPGKIKRYIQEIQKANDLLMKPSHHSPLEHSVHKAERIIKALDSEEDRRLFIDSLPEGTKNKLPTELPPPRIDSMPIEVRRKEEEFGFYLDNFTQEFKEKLDDLSIKDQDILNGIISRNKAFNTDDLVKSGNLYRTAAERFISILLSCGLAKEIYLEAGKITYELDQTFVLWYQRRQSKVRLHYLYKSFADNIEKHQIKYSYFKNRPSLIRSINFKFNGEINNS